MIIMLMNADKKFTHTELLKVPELDLRLVGYKRALHSGRLPAATYIFTDLDRLSYWELELASLLYIQLRAAGLKVLNDPARVRQRFSLLRGLKDSGFNSFDVWRVEDGGRPDRFPVFLRTQSSHRGPLSDILNGPDEVEAAIEDALARGVPMRELMVVEYRAQPLREGLFRKLSVYRLGPVMVPSLCTHDDHWAAKVGKTGLAGQELYDDEFEIARTNRYAEAILPAFEMAGIEYGRADFGIVDGRCEVYEINTNPTVGPLTAHPFPIRLEADRLCFGGYVKALSDLDSLPGRSIRIDDKVLNFQRRRDLRTFGDSYRG